MIWERSVHVGEAEKRDRSTERSWQRGRKRGQLRVLWSRLDLVIITSWEMLCNQNNNSPQGSESFYPFTSEGLFYTAHDSRFMQLLELTANKSGMTFRLTFWIKPSYCVTLPREWYIKVFCHLLSKRANNLHLYLMRLFFPFSFIIHILVYSFSQHLDGRSVRCSELLLKHAEDCC